MQNRTIVAIGIVSILLALLLAVGSTLAGPPLPGGQGSGAIILTDTGGTQGSGIEFGAQSLVGTAFTYQGQLTDGGNPANGTYDFEFKLYDAATNGTLIGTVTQDDVIVANGLLNTTLGFGSGAFNGEARWLDIGVRSGSSSGAYTGLSPRQALTPAPYALALPGMRTLQNATSPNVIGGHNGNDVGSGVVGAAIGGGGRSGAPNQVLGDYGTVAGGGANTASDDEATVGGGWSNVARGQAATIAGGTSNTASGTLATVGGGWDNFAGGSAATVAGGEFITVTGQAATVAGGSHITVTNQYAAVGGGQHNVASGDWATVGGGYSNTASGEAATIGGGRYATVTGYGATVAGGHYITVTSEWGAVGGGVNNAVRWPTHGLYESAAATIGGGQNNEVSEAHATVGGGGNNTASGYASVVGGGGGYESYMTLLLEWPSAGNIAGGAWSTVSGGGKNTASGDAATIGGGFGNEASADYATISGGGPEPPSVNDPAGGNRVTDAYGTIGGGTGNLAGGEETFPTNSTYATVGGGRLNKATWRGATVAGGEKNAATGIYATVGGGRSNSAGHDQATVAGGDGNAANNVYAAVGGGAGNTASGWSATVPGGENNAAEGNYSFAAGFRAKALHGGTFVWADSTDADFASTNTDQFQVRATNGALVVSNNTGYGLLVDNDGNGDGLRAYASVSEGTNWAAVYASNNGTSPAVFADSNGTYSGYFMDSIYVAGSCVGCVLAYVGVNDGRETLEAGDLVAISGVSSPLAGTTTPVLRVRRAGAGSAPIGVVQGKAEVVGSDKDGGRLESADRVEGTAGPGDYVLIVVHGMAYVKADATSAAIAPGQRLTGSDQPGHVRALRTRMLEDMMVTEGAPVVGIALAPLDKDTGLILVFVTLR